MVWETWPQAFLERMRSQLGPDYPDYLASLEQPRAAALRRSPWKGASRTLPFEAETVPWEKLGRYCTPDSRPGGHLFHAAGVYYLQEASAMAPAALLNPRPGEWVCDLCAAPGGKSTQIGAHLAGQGLLLANEIHPRRAAVLSENLERMGISNALVTCESPQRLARRFAGQFDRVLVDAPCSGEGMFRKEPAAVADWSPDTVAMCARRQKEILSWGAELVRPGGHLVYSTCTFAPEEDEGVAEAFLADHPDFVPEAAEVPWFDSGSPGIYRLWPHKLRGEGHFAAVFRRLGDGEAVHRRISPQPLPDEGRRFLQELGIPLPAGTALPFGDTWFWVPETLPELSGLRVLRAGLELGQLRRGRFLPSHALALWLGGCSRELQLSSGEKAAEDYLHGETLPWEGRGWCLVKVDDLSIGWGKGDGKLLKNHYPKGLRR